MSTDNPRWLRIAYENAAEAYLRSLPPEHFMEATTQGTQRKITLESLDLVHADRSDVQVFNELLVQYPLGREALGQVVPDNMVIVHAEPIRANLSYDMPLQPVQPFWMLEYVSKHNQRKDYEESVRRYESELKVPYLLLFYPDAQELTLFRHGGRKYRAVRPNAAGRYALLELDLEVALLDGWVRFWYKGELLPLPADLQRDLIETRRQLQQAREQAHKAQEQVNRERQEKERLLAQLRELGIEPRL
jgi:Putative restriction endonuclease